MLGKKWPMLLAEHLNYFNRRSLRLCGELAGLTWIHFGRQRVLYSMEYILARLAQHRIPGASLARGISRPLLGKVLVPIHIGDTVGIWSR